MARPKMIVYQQASVDGRLAVSPETLLLFGDERWNAVAGHTQEIWNWVRAAYQPQVILEGSGSFCLEGGIPEALPPVHGDPTSLYQDFLPEHIVNRSGHRGWFTVVDSRGRGRWYYKEFPDPEWQGWYLLVLVCHQTPPDYLAYLRREDIPYLIAGEERVDLNLAVQRLADQMGATCIVSEAGGRLNGGLLRADLVDEIHIETIPALIGGTTTSALFTAPDLQANDLPTRLKLISVQVREDDHIWSHYRVLRD